MSSRIPVFCILALFLVTAGPAEALPRVEPEDCATVEKLLGLLPAQVVAYYGVKEVSRLERVDPMLDEALIRLALYDNTLFGWNRLGDFSEVALECALSWPANHVRLFEHIHGRSQKIFKEIRAYRKTLSRLADPEIAAWMIGGFSATEAEKQIGLGRSPQEAARGGR